MILISEILKAKQHEQLWELAETKIIQFNCYPESVEELLESQKEVYFEEGYEVLDAFIEADYRMCRVKLLIKLLSREDIKDEELLKQAECRVINAKDDDFISANEVLKALSITKEELKSIKVELE